MHHGLNTDQVLHLNSDILGNISSGATSAPSDVAENGSIGNEPFLTLKKVLDSLLCPRGKKLEREEGPTLFNLKINLINNFHSLKK
mmetsp:Transcript_30187/g.55158  ORF Transcript_30187/g.55158 Transcript_30187/m.55158 type:complete len:86 (-) Transcript_30187:51-308(-)